MIRGQVSVEGLGDLRRAIRQIDKANGKAEGLPAFRKFLKYAVEPVIDEAKRLAPRGTKPIPAGRRPRKRLVDTVRPIIRTDTAFIFAGALVRSGPPKNFGRFGAQKQWWGGDGTYRYARRIEYEETSRGRPFMRPALESKSDEVARRMEGVLDAIERAWGNQ